jgi:hypothetical protein
MIKRVDSARSWVLVDTARLPRNPTGGVLLLADNSVAEYTDAGNTMDLLGDGFKFRGTNGETNASGGTYIYLAMADIAGGGELPYPLAR